MTRALLREVPDTFDRAIVTHGERTPDPSLAKLEHSAYRKQFELAGFDVDVLPAVNSQPDCVFIEDTAVVIGSIALITRPGAPSRRDEVDPVADVLGLTHELAHMVEPGTLDGGDVLQMGQTVYAGRSKRTNQSGIEQLREVAAAQDMDLVAVDVAHVLHLKSGVMAVTQDTVVVTPGTVDEDRLGDLRTIHESDEERYRFSAVCLDGNRVMVTAAAPRTAELVAAIGQEIVPIDVTEIQAADGGLTCLSIIY